MVRFYSTQRPDEIVLVRGLLAEHGIETVTHDYLPDSLRHCEIWLVHDGDLERARTCLEQARPMPGYCPACGYDLRGLPEPRCPECGERFDRRRRVPDWICPRCGEQHGGQFTECWKCGQAQPGRDEQSDLHHPIPPAREDD